MATSEPTRRAVLAALATGGFTLGTGALAEPSRSGPTIDAPTLAELGYPGGVCRESIDEDFSITAIDDPAFGPDWASIEVEERYVVNDRPLADADVIIGLTAGDRARAYPLSVLFWHEIVNDTLPGGSGDGNGDETDGASGTAGGEPVIVTYCSICKSGMVARRTVDGEPTTFGVSGLLWAPPDLYARASEEEGRTFGAVRGNASAEVDVRVSGNLVMYDGATRSYWSQILAQAICGPKRGTELTIRPSTLTTWGEWRRAHPDTEVLLPPPRSGTM